MVDFEPHKVIEDMLHEPGIGAATMVFYLWFASRFPKGADLETIQIEYGISRRHTFRHISKLTELDLMYKRMPLRSPRPIYTPRF